jgi:hypothetical protein
LKIVPVIFEDHSLAMMRPLAWSTPMFELRCGMFNTRERVGMCSGGTGGVLLGRSFLSGLNSAAGWTWGAEGIKGRPRAEERYLFLNGLLAPDFLLISDLFARAAEEGDFFWRTDAGLVAALVGRTQAEILAADWSTWESRCANEGKWSDPKGIPDSWLGESLECPPLSEAGLSDLPGRQAAAPRRIWDIVSSTGAALVGDLDFARTLEFYHREPFGVFPLENDPAPVWARETSLVTLAEAMATGNLTGLAADHRGRVFCGADVKLAPGTVLNTEAGPIILDNDVTVMPHCYLEGPLYIGPGSLVKPGSRIHGESSFGIVNRLAGEIGESTFGDFANKQHEGFIGHAVLGSWINLGAMTTCSDLKNNYGEIRVDLGAGAVPTGSRFVGLMMGDHAKTAIGTLFNTGTSVGFASNIFNTGMPPKMIGNFRWGGSPDSPPYAVDRALATAETVMGRRDCAFTSDHRGLFQFLGP